MMDIFVIFFFPNILPEFETRLQVFGRRRTNVECAYQEYSKFYAMESKTLSLDSIDTKTKIHNCSKKQLSDICHVGQDHSVDVTISVEAGQESITIEGCDRDVVMTQVAVEQYLWTIDLEHLNVKEYLEKHWSPDDKSQIYQLDTLCEEEEERQMVIKNIKATGGPKNILRIEKLKNPTLKAGYIAKRSQINKANGENHKNIEKILYHGTSAESIDSINRMGFNKGFCGKNAVKYGQGVYFARDSSYSANRNFSPPDLRGHRYMYQCRVITGRYALGNEAMRMPPIIEGQDIRYDCTVNHEKDPNIFVIYHDCQAYPEYLITFK